MHFVHSKPLNDFSGTIQRALFHYENQIKDAESLPNACDTDPNSPREIMVIDWIKNTTFFDENKDSIKVTAQFPIGKYLRQLDPSYNHGDYKTDFLLSYSSEENKTVNIVIEYDGFEDHFINYQDVNEMNYEHYYNKDDIERQLVLEGYGYNFIRLNRFNTKTDPAIYLNNRIQQIVKKKE